MKPDLKFLMMIAEEVKRKTQPLMGSKDAGRHLGIGAGGDHTTKLDMMAEQTVLNMLKEHDVPCTVVSEESGVAEILDGSPDVYLIVDSIDGTNNALRNIPFFTISLALADKPRLSSVHTGLVLDLPRNIAFTAEKGKGAMLDGGFIKPSNMRNVKDALLGLNISAVASLSDGLVKLISLSQHIRHLGANSLEVCYVASGRLDAYIDIRGKLRVTDLAASYLILREAGGFIISEKGSALDGLADSPARRFSFIAAGNLELLNSLSSILLGAKV